MAPEQARGMARQLDRRADVYSLGAMLYELLCGKPPFEAENEVDLLMAVLHQDPIPLRQRDLSIPVDLEIIAHKCLRKEPGQRYDSAQALAEDLGRYLRGEAIMARPASTLYKLRRLASRHRAPFAVGLVVFLSMVTLLAMWGQARAQRRQAEQQAAEQERLAVQLGQSVTEMKLFLRVAYSLPPHDLRRDKEVVRERLRKLDNQLQTSDRFLHGTIESALGQGYLALEEFEPAVLHLQRAIELGENTTGTHLALGEALTQLYQSMAEDVRRQNDPAETQRKLDELGARFLPRARKELQLGKEADQGANAYIDALLWRYADPPSPQKALDAARRAKEASPWQLEPMTLELRILSEQVRAEMLSAQRPSEPEMDKMQATLEQSISTVRSYPPFYDMHAAFVSARLRSHYVEPRALSPSDRTYRAGIEYAKTWAQILPASGQPLDGLLGIHTSLAFSMAWKNLDPRPVVADGLLVLAEAKKYQPERVPTFLGEMGLHHALARYDEFIGESSTAELESALQAARKITELAPQEADTWAQFSLATFMLGSNRHMYGMDARSDLRQAIALQERAIKQNPAKLLWFNNLAAFQMVLAEIAQSHGEDPSPIRQQAVAILHSTLAKNPSFVLAEENLMSLQSEDVRYRIETGQVRADMLPKLIEQASQLLQKYPDSAGVQYHYLDALLTRCSALLQLNQPALAAIDEALTLLKGPQLSAIAEGLRQDKLGQLELMKMRALIQQGQSPADSLLALLSYMPLQSLAKGAQVMDRHLSRIEAMRRYAEWLMKPGVKPAKSPLLPTSALAAVTRALAMTEQFAPKMIDTEKKRQVELAILLLHKAKLDPKADANGLTTRATALQKQLAQVRPLLARKIEPYLPASPVAPPQAL